MNNTIIACRNCGGTTKAIINLRMDEKKETLYICEACKIAFRVPTHETLFKDDKNE